MTSPPLPGAAGAQLTLLLVDDDDVAAEAVERNLRKFDIRHPVIWAENGRAALAVLRGTDPQRRLEAPGQVVVLLDLNMPVMNGFEFLAELRGDPDLHHTVVFVLTTSGSDVDRTRAYEHVIAGYMVKSSVGPQFSKLARLIASFSDAVELPERRGCAR